CLFQSRLPLPAVSFQFSVNYAVHIILVPAFDPYLTGSRFTVVYFTLQIVVHIQIVDSINTVQFITVKSVDIVIGHYLVVHSIRIYDEGLKLLLRHQASAPTADFFVISNQVGQGGVNIHLLCQLHIYSFQIILRIGLIKKDGYGKTVHHFLILGTMNFIGMISGYDEDSILKPGLAFY